MQEEQDILIESILELAREIHRETGTVEILELLLFYY